MNLLTLPSPRGPSKSKLCLPILLSRDLTPLRLPLLACNCVYAMNYGSRPKMFPLEFHKNPLPECRNSWKRNRRGVLCDLPSGFMLGKLHINQTIIYNIFFTSSIIQFVFIRRARETERSREPLSFFDYSAYPSWGRKLNTLCHVQCCTLLPVRFAHSRIAARTAASYPQCLFASLKLQENIVENQSNLLPRG